MRITGISFFLFICMMTVSVMLDVLQGMTFTEATQNNVAAFGVLTLGDWLIVIFFFVIIFVEVIMILKKKKQQS
ncbi:hypothetical protein HOO54_04455 [Bacillus sp. WMMC1349]|uniref:hypothetical protein n=1 Tax=Bacillus sp. WMMC1349 TaxID=2736254 RepID=UPI0015531334|nr:hypothetical protein [Bacillus sp. WMMC1349]NPC91514.1 hypothetical protein [Bacillus sp. WMMC1349]